MSQKKPETISKGMARRAAQRRKKRQTQIVGALVSILILSGIAWVVLGSNPASTESIQSSLPSSISVEEAYPRYEEGNFFLDVRTLEEWNEYHIPGTTLIPLDQLESRVKEVPSDMDVVVVCRSGNRSQVGRDILLDAGFTQVTSMDGGVSSWRDAGYPIE